MKRRSEIFKPEKSLFLLPTAGKEHWELLSSNQFIPRGNHRSIIYDDKIYCFGGEIELNYKKLNEVDVFDMNTKQWSRIEAKGVRPTKRDGMSMVLYKDAFYIFGGTLELQEYTIPKHEYEEQEIPLECCDKNIFRFDLKTHEWSTLKTKGDENLVPRREHTANVYGDSMYIFGGLVGEECRVSNSMYEFNFITNQWTKIEYTQKENQIPKKRRAHSMVLHNQTLVLYGGCGDDYELYNDVWYFDLESKLWTKINTHGDPQYERLYHTAVALHDSMYVFGGMNSYSDVYKYNFVTHQWTKIFDPEHDEKDEKIYPPHGRFCHSAAVHKNSMIIIGGEDLTRKIFNDVYKFNFMAHLFKQKLKQDINEAAQKKQSLHSKILDKLKFKGI